MAPTLVHLDFPAFTTICHWHLSRKKTFLTTSISYVSYVFGSPREKYIHFASINKDGLLRKVFTHIELLSSTITAYLTIS